jgi:hypothetical protein
MKVLYIIYTFLFANIIFAIKECNIEINTQNENTWKSINIKCYKNDIYCDDIINEVNNIYGENILDLLINGDKNKKDISQHTFNIFYYQYEGVHNVSPTNQKKGIKDILNENNFKCQETLTEMEDQRCYQQCMKYKVKDGKLWYNNKWYDAKPGCCFSCGDDLFCSHTET